MRKVLWFSRHEMTTPQRNALGDAEITQVSRTIAHASELSAEITQADIIAIVAPIGLQQEFLRAAGGKPVITAVSERILIPQENGEPKAEFRFVKWEQLDEIKVVKHDFVI